jgi:signal peptidase I
MVDRSPQARPISALLLALIAAGAGHFAIGRWRRGLVWLFVTDLALSICVATLLAGHLGAVWAMLAMGLLVHVASVVDVVRIRRVAADVPHAGLVALAVVGLLGLASAESLWLHTTRLEVYRIANGSMIPTLMVGDHVFADKRAFTPARGDMIVFRSPAAPDTLYVKRVIGVGGDTVEVREGVPVVNGKPAEQTRLGPAEYQDVERTFEFMRARERLDGHEYELVLDPREQPRDFPPITVPAGAAYVMGDNRDNSHDSRFWGALPASNILGRYLGIWYSERR